MRMRINFDSVSSWFSIHYSFKLNIELDLFTGLFSCFFFWIVVASPPQLGFKLFNYISATSSFTVWLILMKTYKNEY